MDPLFSARLKASFKELADQQEKKGESAFSEKWSKHFYEAYEQQSIEERKKRISDVYYRFDYLDMLFFTASIRYKFNSSFDSGLSLKDGSSDICENSLGVLLLNPCSVDEVNGKLSEILEKIRIRWKTTTKLSYIIIPFFTGEYWMCVRVELNQEKKSISVLFDDPQGGVFDKNDKVPGDKDNKVRNVISKRVVDNVMKAANSCIASYLSRRAGDRHLQLHSRSFVCKHVDQQGYLANDCDSGPIILSNIQDYLKMTGKRKLYSNRAFEHTAKLYKAAGVMKDHNLSQYRCEESEPEARESLDEEKGGLYHISEYVLKSVKNLYSTSQLREARDDFCGFYERHQPHYEKLLEDNNQSNKRYLRYLKDYIRSLLKRVPLDRRGDLQKKIFKLKVGFTVGKFLSELLFKVFHPLRPTRKNPYHEGDKFKDEVFRIVFDGFSKRKLVGSKSPKASKSQGKGQGRALGSVSRRASSRLPLSWQPSFWSARKAEAPKAVYASANQPSMKFDCYEVDGSEGDCGYNAFCITRDKACELIKENLSDMTVQLLLKNAVLEQMINSPFIGYLQQHIQGHDDIDDAYKEYLQTDQKEDLEALLENDNGNCSEILTCYLEYDITEKSIDAGWCHPCVLQALAHVRDFRLRMWVKGDDDDRLTPYQQADGTAYQAYNDFNADKEACVDLLFVNGNHFERLFEQEASAAQQQASSAKKLSAFDFGTSSEDDDPSYMTGREVEPAATNKKRKVFGGRSGAAKSAGSSASSGKSKGGGHAAKKGKTPSKKSLPLKLFSDTSARGGKRASAASRGGSVGANQARASSNQSALMPLRKKRSSGASSALGGQPQAKSSRHG